MKKSDAGQSTSSTSGPADTLKYKGVRKRKWGKWVSEIRLPNSRDRIWLGSYDSPLKAARAFDAAQFCLRGRSANFNFPDNPPEITRTRSMTPSEIQAAAARFANMVVDEPAENNQHTVETTTAEESMTSYSPSISDGATTSTAQMESEVTGVEKSFYEQLNLTANFGSDNFGLDFGFFNGFDEFGPGNFYSPVPVDLDCGYDGEDCYDASIYQGSFLWNF